MDLYGLMESCAPGVSPQTMARVLKIESSHNPYAIGIVGHRLQRQPQNLQEAIATAQYLLSNGYNFSAGIGQVNYKNFAKTGLSISNVFEPCANLRASSSILKECYQRASGKYQHEQHALRAAFSCYYSGRLDSKVGWDYASKVAGDAKGRK
jgi:type IV secretion system protein VirB1